MEFYKVHSITFDDIRRYNYDNMRLGVIVHIVDESGKILLQKRGPKCKDDALLFEDVGGKLEDNDLDFKSAYIREMKEEMGPEAVFELSNPVGIYHCEKNGVNWIFVIFSAKYIKGNFLVMEDKKCLGYKFFDYEEITNSNEVSEGSKFLTKSLKKEYNI